MDYTIKPLASDEPSNAPQITPLTTASSLKEMGLKSLSTAKQAALPSTSQAKTGENPFAAEEVKTIRDIELAVSRVDRNDYEQMRNYLRNNPNDDVKVKDYLQRKYKFDDTQYQAVRNHMDLVNLNLDEEQRKQTQDPWSEGALGDTAIALAKGGLESSQGINAILDKGGRQLAKVLPESIGQGLNRLTEQQLVNNQRARDALSKEFSYETQESNQAIQEEISKAAAENKEAYKDSPVKRTLADAATAFSAYVTNPRALAFEVIQEVPSVITGGVVFKAVGNQLAKQYTKKGISPEAQAKLQQRTSSLFGIGSEVAGEGLSNGAEAKVAILEMSEEDLMKSPRYAAMVKDNVDPQVARSQLADEAFNTAFSVAAGAALLLGAAAKKANLDQINQAESNFLISGNPAVSIAGQGVQEGILGGVGQYGQNLAMQETVNPNQDMVKGVGTGIGAGAAVGAATSAAFNAVPMVGTAAGKAIEGAAKAGTAILGAIPKKVDKPRTNFAGFKVEDVSDDDAFDLVTKTDVSKPTLDIIAVAAQAMTENNLSKLTTDTEILNHYSNLRTFLEKGIQLDTAVAKGKDKDTVLNDRIDNEYAPLYERVAQAEQLIIDKMSEDEWNAYQATLGTESEDDDDTKADKLVSMGSLILSDDESFKKQVRNLATSSTVSGNKQQALVALATVGEAIADLRSNGSAKGTADVAKDILEGNSEWRGLMSYTKSILAGLKTKNISNIENTFRELKRFNADRQAKYKLAEAYVNAKTKEAKAIALEAYANQFGNKSEVFTKLVREGKNPINGKFLESLKFEAEAMQNGVDALVNLARSTVNMATTSQEASQSNEATTPTVDTSQGTTTQPDAFQEAATLDDLINEGQMEEQAEATATTGLDFTDQTLSVIQEEVEPATEVDQVITQMEQEDANPNNTLATDEDQVEEEDADGEEEDEDEVVTEDEEIIEEETPPKDEEPEEAVPETAAQQRTKRERITKLMESKDKLPEWFLTAYENKGNNITSRAVERAEIALQKRLERDEKKAKKDALAAKVKEFNPQARERILKAIRKLTKLNKKEAAEKAKIIRDLFKNYLNKNPETPVEQMLALVDQYVEGIEYAAVNRDGLPNGETKTFRSAGYKVGIALDARTTIGDYYLSQGVYGEDTYLEVKGQTQVKDFMLTNDLEKFITKTFDDIEAEALLDWMTAFKESFYRVVKLNPDWKSSQYMEMWKNLQLKGTNELPNSFIAVASLVASNWVSTANDVRTMDDEDVLKAHGMEGAVMTPAEMQVLRTGLPISRGVENMGRELMRQLGLKAKPISGVYEQRFPITMGQMLIAVLNDMKAIKVDVIDLNAPIQDEEASIFDSASGEPTPKLPNGIRTVYSLREDGLTYGSQVMLSANRDLNQKIEEVFFKPSKPAIPEVKVPTKGQIDDKVLGGQTKVPEEVKEIYDTANKREWGAKVGVTFLLDIFTPEQSAMLGGGIQDTSRIAAYRRFNAKAKFDGLVREINLTKAFLDGIGDLPIYLLHTMWTVGRTGFKNSILNPQSSKVARHLIALKDWTRTVDLSNPEQSRAFYLAMAFNLGFDLDKAKSPDEVIAEFMDMVQNNEDFLAAVKAYKLLNSDTLDDDAKQVQADELFRRVQALKGKPDKNGWGVIDAISAWSKVRDDKPFTTDLMVEIDGITNGVMISSLLFGLTDMKLYEKGGMYSDGQNFTDWSKNKSNLDSYKTLARYIAEKARNFEKYGAELAAKYIKNPGSLTPDEQDTLRQALGVNVNNANFKAKNTELKRRRALEFVWKQMKAAKVIAGPFEINDMITAAWRNLAKDPLMTTNYGAGIIKVTEKLIEEIVTKMHDELALYDDSDKTNPKSIRALNIIDSLNVMMGKNKIDFPYGQPHEFKLTPDQMNTLRRSIRISIGNPLKAALREEYSEYNKTKKLLSDVVNFHSRIGSTLINMDLNKWSEENSNHEPPEEVARAIYNKHKKYLGTLPTLFSTGLEEEMLLNKMELSATNNTGSRTKGVVVKDQKHPVTGESVKTRGNYIAKSEFNPTDTFKNLTETIGQWTIEDAGAKALPYLVQGTDGAVSIGGLKEMALLNVHDGFGSAYDQVIPMAQMLNQKFKEAVESHTVWDRIEEMHEAIGKAYRGEFGDEVKRMLTSAKTEAEQGRIEQLIGEGFFDGPEGQYAVIRMNRTETVGKISSWGQYYHPTGEYKTNPDASQEVTEKNLDQAVSNALDEMAKEAESTFLGSNPSSPLGFLRSGEKVERVEGITAGNATALLEDLIKMDSVQENPDHLNHLREVLSELVESVVTPIDVQVIKGSPINEGIVEATADGQIKNVFLRVGREASSVNPQASMAEVYTHEMVHATTLASLYRDSAMTRMLDNMFKVVSSVLTPEDLIDPNDTDEQKQRMREVYNYVFNNVDTTRRSKRNEANIEVEDVRNNYLAEFMAYSLTNERFLAALNKDKVRDALSKKQLIKTNTQGRTIIGSGLNSAFDWIVAVFKFMVMQLSMKVMGISSSQLPSDQVFYLAKKMAGITVEHQTRLAKVLDKWDSFTNDVVRTAIKKFVVAPLVKLVTSNMVANNKYVAVRFANNVYKLATQVPKPVYMKAMKAVTSRFELTHDSFLRAFVTEVRGETKRTHMLHVLHRMSNKFIDQLRMEVRNQTVNFLRSVAPRPLTSTEKEAMTSVLLETDLSSLLERGFKLEDVMDLLVNTNKRNTQIAAYRQQIRSLYPNNKGWYLNQVTSLANMMVGKYPTQAKTPPNANLIATLAGNTNLTPEGDLDQAEAILDVLATLEAISLVPNEDRQAVYNLYKEEMITGGQSIMTTLNLSSNFKVDSFDTIFGGNKALMRKGYVKEQFDPNISMEFVLAEDLPEALDRGFEIRGKTKRSFTDKNESVYIMTSNRTAMSRWNAGIVGMTGTTHKGATIRDVYYQLPEARRNTKVSDVKREFDALDKAASVEGYTPPREVLLTPLFNENGGIVDYRYMMTKQDKVDLLKRNNNYDELLAAGVATMRAKDNTKMINDKTAEAIYKDYKENFARNPNDYITLSAKSTDARLKEMYSLIPESMRAAAKKYYGNDKIVIHKDDYRLVFGYRKWSITELGKKQFSNAKKNLLIGLANKLLASLDKPIVRDVEAAIMELASMFKDLLVVKTGLTLLMNMFSNLVTLMTEGVDPISAVAGMLDGWNEISKYQTMRDENSKLRMQLDTDDTLSLSDRRKKQSAIERNLQRMSLSPVKDLVDEGVYQTIAEDVGDIDGNYSYSSKLAEWASPVWSRVPDGVKDVTDILFMTHNTKLYKTLRNATQVSDFAARYVMHKHQMKKGMSKEDSISKVISTFVNYDLPTHESLQWLSDIGIMMFAKYMIRTHKVMYRQVKERPFSALTVMLSSYGMGLDIPSIYDVFVLHDDVITNRISDPIEAAWGLMTVPLLNQ